MVIQHNPPLLVEKSCTVIYCTGCLTDSHTRTFTHTHTVTLRDRGAIGHYRSVFLETEHKGRGADKFICFHVDMKRQYV